MPLDAPCDASKCRVLDGFGLACKSGDLLAHRAILRCWAAIDLNSFGEPRKIADGIGIVTSSNIALVGKRSGGNSPTFVLLAYQILSGNSHIVEEYLVEAHLSVYLNHRTGGDARRLHVYQYVR